MQAFAIFAIIIAVVGCVAGFLKQEWAAVIVALAVIALAIHPAFNLS